MTDFAALSLSDAAAWIRDRDVKITRLLITRTWAGFSVLGKGNLGRAYFSFCLTRDEALQLAAFIQDDREDVDARP
jgi:hypothetical protein